MAPTRFLHLFALLSLALLACSFGATPATALSVDGIHVRDVAAHGHGAIAKRKRENDTTNAKRGACKVRPSSSPAPAPTTSPAKATTPKPTSTSKSSSTSTKHSSSAVAVSSPAPVSSGGGKVGVSWANGNSPNLKNFVTSQTKFLYTWAPEIPSNAKSLGFRTMPMLWCSNQIADFQKLVVKGYADIAMGMNEPNEPGQCNISPSYGAQLWKQYLQPLRAIGYQLVSPATSSNPNGLTWVQNFYSACNGGCTADYTAIHWYDVSAQAFITYLELWYKTFGKPIMVTEFACQNFNGGAQCTQSQVNSFMATVTSFMQSTDWVVAYFAFGVMTDMQGVNPDNQLMNSAGYPTALGQLYINGQ